MRWWFNRGTETASREDTLRALVKTIAKARNPHLLLSCVAADLRLLTKARECYGRFTRKFPSRAGSKEEAVLAMLCRDYRISRDEFERVIHFIVQTLHLAERDQSHYEVLGVDRRANREEIKRAFRRLSLCCHPDRNSDNPDAGERFRSLYQAYRTLSDDALRQQYDRFLARPWEQRESGEWEEAEATKARQQNWRCISSIALAVVVLLIVTSLVDQDWLTRRAFQSQGTLRPSETFQDLSASAGTGRSLREAVGEEGALTAPYSLDAAVPAPALTNDLDQRVKEFLSRYARACERRDLGGLATLFEPDALESGTSITALIPHYGRSLGRRSSVRYEIALTKCFPANGEIEAGGDLYLLAEVQRDAVLLSTGEIRFRLIDHRGTLRAKRLEYSLWDEGSFASMLSVQDKRGAR